MSLNVLVCHNHSILPSLTDLSCKWWSQRDLVTVQNLYITGIFLHSNNYYQSSHDLYHIFFLDIYNWEIMFGTISLPLNQCQWTYLCISFCLARYPFSVGFCGYFLWLYIHSSTPKKANIGERVEYWNQRWCLAGHFWSNLHN